MATKTELVYNRINELVEGGMEKADAFRQVAEELNRSVDGVRGSYYAFSGGKVGQGRRPRRRETRLQDAVADARAALERAIESVDREVEAAAERAAEFQAEAEALAESAEARKTAITEKLETLR